ncbi:MAG: 50S ribosomal protein L1 [Candidatus Aenigmarchaeota archaeon]|nr:50S ribosomal protein L1 [Candidatus Aenigmarchaeota archaeon]MCK5321715.1 50S ribosomal protein L1 [Candidatus Aenigmarchaeota archaeon]
MAEYSGFIKTAKEKATKRNFTQSVDIVISIKGLNLKQQTNKFKDSIILPKGRGESARIGVIGSELILKAKDADVKISNEDLSKIKNKKDAKKIADKADFFIADPKVMVMIGKSLGPILGPRNKMPKPFPPVGDPTGLIKSLRNTVNIKLQDTPVIQCLIGNEKMSDEDLATNAKEIMNRILSKLPSGQQNIKAVYFKTTMGPAVKTE